MKRLFLTAILAVVFAAGAFAQSAAHDLFNASGQQGLEQLVDAPDAQEVTPAERVSLPMPAKTWTIMVFSNGKSDLSKYCEGDVCEILRAGSTASRNIVVQQGSMDTTGGQRTFKVRRLYVMDKKPSDGAFAKIQPLASSDKIDMGDWKEVLKFIQYSKSNFPAAGYLLIIAGHATGWIAGQPKPMSGDDLFSSDRSGGFIAPDFETGNFISTEEMAQLMKAAGRIDVLAYDSCFMADIAVDAQISTYVNYIVASEDVEPLTGYNYTRILNKFSEKPQMDAKEAAVSLATAFGQSYPSGESVTTSAIDSKKIQLLSRHTANFVKLALASPDKKALVSAYKQAHRFTFPHAADYYDFLRLVNEKTTDAKLKAYASGMMQFLSSEVVLKNIAYGKHAGKAHGLACYLPLKQYDYHYDDLLKRQIAKAGGGIKNSVK